MGGNTQEEQAGPGDCECVGFPLWLVVKASGVGDEQVTRERMLPGSGAMERCNLFVQVVVTVAVPACTTPSTVSWCIGARIVSGV